MSGVTGINALGALARDARLAGGKVLPDLRKRMGKLGPPAKKAVQTQARAKLPKSGGLAEVMARAIRMRVKTDTGFTTAGVTLVTSASGRSRLRHIDAINRGTLRHPVYGRRGAWVTQRVPVGFWDAAMDETSDRAHQYVREVLAETARTLKGHP